MKLALLSYGIGSRWSLEEMVGIAGRHGFAGLDFRCEYGNAHGVEVERTAAERRLIRHRIEDAFLELVCIRSGARFESPDPLERLRNLDRAKRHLELAADLGASYVRVSGHNIPEGAQRERIVDQVAEGLSELADEAEGSGVEVLLEMLGDFKNWHYATRAVEQADRPNVGYLYNSEMCDVFAGSLSAVLDRIAGRIGHVDLHDIGGDFPYEELFSRLEAAGYRGYFSPEPHLESPTPEDYVALYAGLARARRERA